MARRSIFLFFILIFGICIRVTAQTADEIIRQIKTKLEQVDDYKAKAKLKTNVAFIKAPIANVDIYFKRPNKLRIHNESGISFIPRGSINISMNNVFTDISDYDIIDIGKDASTGLRVIKLLPRSDTSEVVLSTLYIDEKQMLIKKAQTTTRDNGTYELEMTYGKYAAYGLADKVIFTFNTKEYKLPKGITFDYDDGLAKKNPADKLKNRKGKVEITYSSYQINQGIPDSVFQ